MLRVSRLTDYGTLVLADMACEPEQVYSAASLARRVSLPVSTVSKLLKMLTRGGILSSSRGKQGGYALARDPETISLAQVVAVLEGPVALTECSLRKGLCGLEAKCRIRRQWQGVNAVLQDTLRNISLRELTADYQRSREPLAVSSIDL